MDVAEFCTQSNVVVVAGKGGVGKTTVTAALGLIAARAGLRVLLVGLDDQLGLPALFGQTSPPRLRGRPAHLGLPARIDDRFALGPGHHL